MHKARILVVEDEMIIAREIMMVLRALGHEAVGSASSGEQAIEMAKALRPNLVLMDIQLAGTMDGITASQAIRKLFDIPSLFLSAFSGSDNLDRAKLATPVGYLNKPFEDEELGAAIEAGLSH
jgi:CheY-like chemotaxis protein